MKFYMPRSETRMGARFRTGGNLERNIQEPYQVYGGSVLACAVLAPRAEWGGYRRRSGIRVEPLGRLNEVGTAGWRAATLDDTISPAAQQQRISIACSKASGPGPLFPGESRPRPVDSAPMRGESSPSSRARPMMSGASGVQTQAAGLGGWGGMNAGPTR